MQKINSFAKRTGLFLFAAAFASTASAQFLRTSYTQDVPYAMQMNPAMVPSHGYFSPILGPFSATMQTNAFGTQDIQDMFDKGGDYYKTNDFLDKLKDENKLNLNMAWDQIAFGWFSGENFFSFSTGTRIEMGATLPKSLFTMMRDFNGVEDLDWTNGGKGLNWDLGGEKLNALIYQEVAIGMTRKITDKLTIGAKAKVLLGAANVDFEISKGSVTTPAGIDVEKIKEIQKGSSNIDWSKFTSEDYKQYTDLVAIRNNIKGESKIELQGSMKAAMGGLEWKHNNDGLINGAKMNGFKVAGYGLGLDLGATYEVMENLKVTAALTDLGFIKWNKDHVQEVTIGVDDSFNLNMGDDTDLFKFAEKVTSNEVVSYDMLKMQEKDGESYTTSLYTTVSVGGQYTLLDDKLVVGALYTGRMAKPKTISEITLSGAYNLSAWANVALSYSMIQSAGKSFGLGLKLGPLYLGTDYMFFGNSSKCVNFLAGLSVPLGKGKSF